MREDNSNRFKGVLNKKLKNKPHPSYLAEVQEWNKWVITRHELQMQTMGKLLSFYQISDQDKNKWFKLAFKLGEQFVPAMQFEEKRGAKKEWDDRSLFALCLLVDQSMNKTEGPKKTAFSKIKKMAIGSDIEQLVKKTEPKTLENKYYEFIKTDAHHLYKNLENIALSENKLSDFYKLIIGK